MKEGADEDDDEEEGMDLAQVQEKLEACSEVELKKMLKDMELPVKGKASATAPRPCTPPGTALSKPRIAPRLAHPTTAACVTLETEPSYGAPSARRKRSWSRASLNP